MESKRLIANMILLGKQLKLPITYKVMEVQGKGGDEPEPSRHFLLIVHVLADHAFKRYLQHCTPSDLMLFRGLLLHVSTSLSMDRIITAGVRQSFLPKFENEGQDSSTADTIVASADDRYMVITIKHSGSLVTLSGSTGFAAKNSLENEYTAGAAVVFFAHYQRLERGDSDKALSRLSSLMSELRSSNMALSFEMVTGHHGHHGQVPRAEYCVATSAQCLEGHMGRPSFLPWLDFLRFCVKHSLPTNDTWLIAGSSRASSARDALDELALCGGPTSKALRILGALVDEGGGSGCLHLPGSYPHDQWQGSRIEGFVVSLGQKIDRVTEEAVKALLPSLQGSVLVLDPNEDNQVSLRERLEPYAFILNEKSKGDVEAAKATIAHGIWSSWLPKSGSLVTLDSSAREAFISNLTRESQEELEEGKEYILRHGDSKASAEDHRSMIYSRLALESLSNPELSSLACNTAAPSSELSEIELRSLKLKAMRSVAGEPDLGVTLRYKKKMMLWTLPSPSPHPSESSPGVVGYCMMTFVIRNGLSALALGEKVYLNYISNLTLGWGIPEGLRAKVHSFACAWSSWISSRPGGVAAVSNSSYLDQAEIFASLFLASDGKLLPQGQVGRPADSFQGLLIVIDRSSELGPLLQEKLIARHLLDPDNLPPFSQSLVREGSILILPESSPVPRMLKQLAEASAAHLFVAVQRLIPESGGGGGEGPAMKKQRGIQTSKIRTLEGALQAAKVKATDRITFIPHSPTEAPKPPCSVIADQLAAWLGKGAPLVVPDPAIIACFVAIPACGKTAVTNGLDSKIQVAAAVHSLTVNLKVLNSDSMKTSIKNYQPNRYWLEVGAATAAAAGTGSSPGSDKSCTLIVADKNLVPSPFNNLQRVIEQLSSGSGPNAATAAILPSCSGPDSSSTHPHLYQGLPDIPFPLELIALCMLRTLKRVKHEGNLDASLPEACSIIAKFALFFRPYTRLRLREKLMSSFCSVVDLPIAKGLGQVSPEISAILEPLLSHVAEGLRNVSESSKAPLPVEWEDKVREMLLSSEVHSALLLLQRPLEEIQEDLSKSLLFALRQQRLKQDQEDHPPSPSLGLTDELVQKLSTETSPPPPSHLAPGSPPLRWLAIAALQVQPLIQAITALGPLVPEGVLQAITKGRSEYHTTLWHVDDPAIGHDTALRDSLVEVIGQEAVVEVLSLDWSLVPPSQEGGEEGGGGGGVRAQLGVVACQVAILSLPLSKLPQGIAERAYPHITLAVVAKEAMAKDSNDMPRLLGEGSAKRLVLPEPISLTGQILSFTEG